MQRLGLGLWRGLAGLISPRTLRQAIGSVIGLWLVVILSFGLTEPTGWKYLLDDYRGSLWRMSIPVLVVFSLILLTTWPVRGIARGLAVVPLHVLIWLVVLALSAWIVYYNTGPSD